MRFTTLILLTFIAFLSQKTWAESSDYPESSKERRRSGSYGAILGNNPDTGRLQILGKSAPGSSKATQESNNQPAKEDSSNYFWQAALDTVRSMPIVAIDSKTGLIATDWQESGQDTRYKFNISVLNNKVKVNAFKQIYKDNGWRDVKEGTDQASDTMLTKIMSRASELQSKMRKQK